jgi:GT2 family glycosyltransferase
MTTIEGKEEMHLARCLSSIRLKSTHHNYKIVVVHHDKLSHEAETVIAHFGASRVAVPGRFNFSRAINEAVKVAHGDQLLLLNDDTEVISPDWLEKLLFFSSQAEIGAVGAKLVFPNGYLQHIGIALSPEGPGHPYYRSPRETSGYLNCCLAPRNWLAVTGACLMTSRRAFEGVHGLDETFELNYNDVDYCLRLWQAGYRCVCDPTVELYHYETMRADGRMKFRPEELQRFNARWAKKYPYDPYFTPEPA